MRGTDDLLDSGPTVIQMGTSYFGGKSEKQKKWNEGVPTGPVGFLSQSLQILELGCYHVVSWHRYLKEGLHPDALVPAACLAGL